MSKSDHKFGGSGNDFMIFNVDVFGFLDKSVNHQYLL